MDDRVFEDIRYTRHNISCSIAIAEPTLSHIPCTGAINVPNLAQPYSAVCSGLTGLLFSGIITVGVSLMS
jgi:hypothetical protein